MQRRYLRVSGIIKDIKSKNKSLIKKESEYIGLFGIFDFYYSRTSNYKKLFFVFKGATKPYHEIKTTIGNVTYDEEGHLCFTTKNHLYIIEIIEKIEN